MKTRTRYLGRSETFLGIPLMTGVVNLLIWASLLVVLSKYAYVAVAGIVISHITLIQFLKHKPKTFFSRKLRYQFSSSSYRNLPDEAFIVGENKCVKKRTLNH